MTTFITSIKNYFTRTCMENPPPENEPIYEEKYVHVQTPTPAQITQVNHKQTQFVTSVISEQRSSFQSMVMRKESTHITREEATKYFKYMLLLFESKIYKISRKKNYPEMKTNTCNKMDNEMIISTGLELICIAKYMSLQLKGIYIVLLYVYYALNLLEQTYDGLMITDIESFFDKPMYRLAYELVYDITLYDILNDNNKNLSSIIRKRFMGLR